MADERLLHVKDPESDSDVQVKVVQDNVPIDKLNSKHIYIYQRGLSTTSTFTTHQQANPILTSQSWSGKKT